MVETLAASCDQTEFYSWIFKYQRIKPNLAAMSLRERSLGWGLAWRIMSCLNFMIIVIFQDRLASSFDHMHLHDLNIWDQSEPIDNLRLSVRERRFHSMVQRVQGKMIKSKRYEHMPPPMKLRIDWKERRFVRSVDVPEVNIIWVTRSQTSRSSKKIPRLHKR